MIFWLMIMLWQCEAEEEPEATESDAQLSGVNILPEAELPEAESKAIMATAKGNEWKGSQLLGLGITESCLSSMR